jgi:phage shock protein A
MSHESTPTADSRELLEKIRSLEEALAFLSHEHDQLRDHFLTLTKAIETCERRILNLERMRFEKEQGPVED